MPPPFSWAVWESDLWRPVGQRENAKQLKTPEQILAKIFLGQREAKNATLKEKASKPGNVAAYLWRA